MFRRDSDLETIRDICTLFSYENQNTFAEQVIASQDKSNSDWFTYEQKEEDVVYSLQKVHKFLEVMAILHFVTEYTDKTEMDMKTTTRTNGIPFALRYDLFKNGVDISKLKENTFVQLKTAKNPNFLFPRGKMIGLYDKTKVEFKKPNNQEDYTEFYEKAKKILELPDAVFEYVKKKEKASKKKSKGPGGRGKSRGRGIRMRNERNMTTVMKAYNLERLDDTAIDGNCFFDALRLTLGLEDTASEIRNNIVDELVRILEKNPDDPISEMIQVRRRGSFVLLDKEEDAYDTKLQNYFRKMRLDGSTSDGVTWADQAIVYAAVSLYRRPIYIINDNLHPNSCINIIRKIDEWDLPGYELDNFIVLGNEREWHFFGTKKLEGFENGKLMSLYFREHNEVSIRQGSHIQDPDDDAGWCHMCTACIKQPQHWYIYTGRP